MRAAIFATFALATLCAGALPPECSNSGAIPPLPTGTTLKQVLAYIRHGDRSLSSQNVCWPNDDVVYQCNLTMIQANNLGTSGSLAPQLVFRRTYEANEEFIPGTCGDGQLTPRGYDQEIKNGQALRSVYIESGGLLPPTLNDASNKMMYLRSDDVQRTIMSGQALVEGMFPPSNDNVTAPNSRVLTWLVRDPYYEDVYPNNMNCPEVQIAYNAAFASTEAKTLFAKYKPIYDEVSQIVGKKYVPNDSSPLDLFDCVYTHVCHDFALPAGLNESFALQAVQLAQEAYVVLHSYNNSYFAKAGMALLVEDTIKAMTAIIEGAAAPTFLVFSGHDTGPIIPFLAAYGVWDGIWPTYAAMITLELHQLNSNASKYSVRMTYGGDVLQIPNCSDSQGLCDWETFLSISNAIAAYGKSCQVGPVVPPRYR